MTEVKSHDELIAEAEAQVPETKAAAKAAADAAKEAEKNHKAAVAYRKGLADDSPEISEADESVSGWAAEMERTKVAATEAKAAAKAATEAVKAAKAEKREAAKAAREEAKAAKAAEKADRVKQNNVLHPLPDSKCGKVWAIFDKISAAENRPALLAEVVAEAEKENEAGAGHSLGNVRAEYSQWRKFHGVPAQGRPKKAEPAPAAPAETA